jgi:hypothetical protein
MGIETKVNYGQETLIEFLYILNFALVHFFFNIYFTFVIKKKIFFVRSVVFAGFKHFFPLEFFFIKILVKKYINLYSSPKTLITMISYSIDFKSAQCIISYFLFIYFVFAICVSYIHVALMVINILCGVGFVAA